MLSACRKRRVALEGLAAAEGPENKAIAESSRHVAPVACRVPGRRIGACARWPAPWWTKRARSRRATRDHVATVNANPGPFCWTKAADDILATVKRFCVTGKSCTPRWEGAALCLNCHRVSGFGGENFAANLERIAKICSEADFSPAADTGIPSSLHDHAGLARVPIFGRVAAPRLRHFRLSPVDADIAASHQQAIREITFERIPGRISCPVPFCRFATRDPRPTGKFRSSRITLSVQQGVSPSGLFD